MKTKRKPESGVPMTKREALALLNSIDTLHCSPAEETDLDWVKHIIESIYNKWWDDALRRVTRYRKLPPRKGSSVERFEYWQNQEWKRRYTFDAEEKYGKKLENLK